MKKRFLFTCFLAPFVVICHSGFAQGNLPNHPGSEGIQPAAKKIETIAQGRIFSSFPVRIEVTHESDESVKAARYLKKLVEEKFEGMTDLTISDRKQPGNAGLNIHISSSVTEKKPPPQYYRIDPEPRKNLFTISSTELLGQLYGIVTLVGLMASEDGKWVIPFCQVEDWPTFSRRVFPSIPEPEDVAGLLDFALKNKIETIALAHRQYPWFEVDERLEAVFSEIKAWKEMYGGPHVMAMHNIYDGQMLEISSENDVERLMEVIEKGLDSGVDKLMILADDTPPFEFGEGYVLPHESDRRRFVHMAEAHCFLIDEILERFADRDDLTEIQYVPAFYTYEDMHYGDMSQYDHTPWEDQAYGPLQRDLDYFGNHLPEEVLIIWTGPNVRTRTLTKEDIEDWTAMLGGKVPFLWDNTIYSHHPFTSTALFTAYDNDFPENLNEISGGNGMLVNGNINAEEMKIGMLTANDFLWDPENYHPRKSLRRAMENRYGTSLVDPLLEFRDTELALRKEIGERDLWFKSDTLWKIIREIRFITEKNPLYYHLNYNGLKAMRMQLKHSVPEPQPREVFLDECKALDVQRREILHDIDMENPDLATELKKILVRLPEE